MLKNYFKIAIRNLTKQKTLAFINIFGLSVGIACFSLFMLYAINEFNFDNFHKNGANIYRVYQTTAAVADNPFGAVPYQPMPLAPAMQRDLPGVEKYVRFLDNWGGKSFIKSDNGMMRENLSFADPSFFTVFSFKLKYGNAATALHDLHSIVLTEETAKKIFGKINVIGKTIDIKTDDKFEPFTVTAVAENLPSNSTLQFTMLGNFDYHAFSKQGSKGVNNWNRISYETFVQLKPGSSLPDDKKLLADFRKKYFPDEEAEARKNGWNGKGSPANYGLQPLQDMHTNIKIDGDAVDPKTIWILLTIAAGILLIACINFTTLAIGRSAGRAKEVGVRKVIGSTRKSLIQQFLIEALLLAFLSGVLGLLLAKILLPFFNQLSGRTLDFSFSQFPQLTWLIVALVFVVGLVAGSYPALLLSNFKPVEVLKTKVKLGGANIFTRSLVTIQFVLSAGLIISTIIILQQLHFMQSKSPGFNKENVVVINAQGISGTKQLYTLFKQELSAYPEIAGIASAEFGLGGGEGWSRSGFKYNGKSKEVYEYFIDPDYMRVLGLTLLAGRNFDQAVITDTVTSVIINEAMMKDFGWTLQNVIDQKIKGYYDDVNDPRTPVVVGVVKNFNYRDMRQQVEPQMFQQFSFYEPQHFFVRIQPGYPSKALSALQTVWKKVAPDYPLQYSFLDENLNGFYETESRWSKIIGWAGAISIFLACLGLLGLAALVVANRTKEIGIRKVLGASLFVIIRLISKDFLKLVLIAFIIATPLAWYFMNKWLQDYAYRINISWWVFVATGATTILIAFLAIGFQSVKAALANPVKSLRTE